MSVPGRACLSSAPIRLHEGSARIPNDRWGYPTRPGSHGPKYIRLRLATYTKEFVQYGNLEGDGASDAVVRLYCDNNGGMAGGVLLYSAAVYSGRGGRVHLLGLITPQTQPERYRATLLGAAKITRGQIVVREFFYRRDDATCCPSGRATTTWKLQHGQLRASRITESGSVGL